MRKSKKLLLLIPLLLVVAIAAIAVLFFSPKTFLKGIDPAAVGSITVVDGNDGTSFVIEDASVIQSIVETLQSSSMKREGLSASSTGWTFQMTFYDNTATELARFYLNSATTIRDGLFLYRSSGELCLDALQELAAKEAPTGQGAQTSYNGAPKIVLHGCDYFATDLSILNELPEGYVYAGELTPEETQYADIDGSQYYIREGAETIADFYVYQECGTPISDHEVDGTQRQWAYVHWSKHD